MTTSEMLGRSKPRLTLVTVHKPCNSPARNRAMIFSCAAHTSDTRASSQYSVQRCRRRGRYCNGPRHGASRCGPREGKMAGTVISATIAALLLRYTIPYLDGPTLGIMIAVVVAGI